MKKKAVLRVVLSGIVAVLLAWTWYVTQ